MAALSYTRARCSGYGTANARRQLRSMPWRTRRTHLAVISASRIRCSATGQSSSSSPGRSSATSSCFGPCPNAWPFSSGSPRSAGSFCLTRRVSGCRTRSRMFARWMRGRPRSRPSWTPSASERPSFSVLSESGPASIVFAATRPERTQALILTGTFAYFGFAGWDDLDRDPAELRARLVPELGEDYTPSVKQLARWQAWCRAAGSAWGSGEALKALLPSVRTSMRQLGMVERMSASPGMARAALEAAFRIDVRPILPTISAPTLVIHARDEAIPVQEGRYIADHIPGARLLEVEGSDHVPWLADPDRILTGMEEFLTGSHAAPSPSRRALRTVLFTDMVACRRNTPRRRATSGGGRCCTGSTRSPRSSRSDSAARWWRARATATSSRSTARRRRSAAPRRCVLRPRHWASRSALASTPASANCGTTASAGLPYTSRRGSSVRPAPGRSSSPAP